ESKCLIRDDDPVNRFLTRHLLHCLEALGLLGWVSESIGMVDDLLGLLDVPRSDKISAFLLDARRVIRSHGSVIDISPLQVYHSAIVFTPKKSVVRRTFRDAFPSWLSLPPKVELDWDACTQTLEGHSHKVISVAFSHDSKTLASASDDRTIKLWDAATGACTATLKGHSREVSSVAFSHDSKMLASASDDASIKLWDAATGTCTATLEIGRVVKHLAFDATSSSLLTDVGSFTLNSLSMSPTASTATPALKVSKAMHSPLSQQVNRCGVGLSEDNVWVTWGSHKVLWLPPSYRPGKSDTIASTVAIGCPSGRILLLAFSFSHDLLI
ncbi:putative WD domain protein, partial [Chaetomidium leptoderma]